MNRYAHIALIGYMAFFMAVGAYFPLSSADGDILVTSPNGGETWTKDEAVTVTWESSLTTPVMIKLYKGGEEYYFLGVKTASDEILSYTVKDFWDDGADYQIRIWDDYGNSDISDGYFTITGGSGPLPVDITVTSPNGGETWTRGAEVTVEWTSTSTTMHTIVLSGTTGEYNLATASASATSATFTLTGSFPDGDDYRIKVKDADGYFDYSDDTFTVTGGNGGGTDGITITSPNGGETWTKGEDISITWESSLTTPVMIELYKGGVKKYFIGVVTASDGVIPYDVKDFWDDGADYRVKIWDDYGNSDMSDGTFTITGGGTLGGISSIWIIFIGVVILIAIAAVIFIATRKRK